MLDAPTLFEARLELLCDRIVGVVADTENCVRRIVLRDNIPEELARARLSSQHGAEFFRERSDIIIENNGTAGELRKSAEEAARILKGDK